MKIKCNKSNPPLGGFLAASFIRATKNASIDIEWGDETAIDGNSSDANEILRFLARNFGEAEFYGQTPVEKTEVDHWLTQSIGPLTLKTEFSAGLDLLNRALVPVTFLVGKRLTIADFAVFSALYSNQQWQELLQKKTCPVNVKRWYDFLQNEENIAKALKLLPAPQPAEKSATRAREGKFVELPGAEMGKVIVRFPPEASGYLHIGHAKAALLNQYYQETFKGKLIMRFDDTNPAKENLEFEKVILEDVEMLQIKPDMFTHTSQYFDLMMEYCEKLLKEGKAYVDDTDAETMKMQREQKVESYNRRNSIEQNLIFWNEMKKGSIKGQQCCVRAKIDMQSANGCLRDPTIYRCKNESHPRTGDKYKVYPTYDFACPIVDSIEGVTHTLRTMEYHDRDPQFYWFIEALELKNKPYIWEYSRLSMTNTVLSKRKLTWFVNEKLVDGWDDPRMPTVRGVLRRGMTVEGLKEFIIAQGSSRSVVFMEWDKIWAFNKKIIDPIAPRFTAVDYNLPVTVLVENVKEECLSVPRHPKNSNVGNKNVWISSRILIDRVDADSIKENENVTFINWGNLMIKKINRENNKITTIEAVPNLDNKDYKKTLKLTWLAETDQATFTPTWCVYFDHLISKPLLGKEEDFKKYVGHETRKEVQMLGDPELKTMKKGDIIQLQRKGFFRVDVPYEPISLHSCKEQPVVLFYIPDGHTKENPINTIAKQAANQDNSQDLIGEQIGDGPKTATDINNEIIKQGDVVRNLKTKKAPKPEIDEAVAVLLSLKADYKKITNTDWKPGCQVPATLNKPKVVTKSDLSKRIKAQYDKVEKMQKEDTKKSICEAEIKILNGLKTEFRQKFNSEWNSSLVKPEETEELKLVNEKIAKQGDKIRELKANKADKSIIEAEVIILLALKNEYKTVCGLEWRAPYVAPVKKAPPPPDTSIEDFLLTSIKDQGDIVRKLKSNTGPTVSKTRIEEQVKILLKLKAEFKEKTGKEWNVSMKPNNPMKKKEPETLKYKCTTGHDFPLVKQPNTWTANSDDLNNAKKQTRLGLEAKKEENLSDWYTQVLTKAELIEYYDVSGCYILRPWSYAIWESIKQWFDAEIRKLGVENCYFPIFVSKSVLEKEQTHIADFSPEVAWVTKSGDSEMAEPIAIRPTSETVMYPAYAKWVQSYRDLPIKLNQWNNVVRWEFKHPQPFLRTREFLWQEGHTAYASETDAKAEVETIIKLYEKIYTDLLAIPVVVGKKTDKEKFAGGDYTLTVEAFVRASGRAIQGATSHHLGQNFSKIFEITYEDPDNQEKKYVYQNSWGITTRTIGVMIMVHGDNKGLVLPPKVASVQIIIVPCGLTASLTEKERKMVFDYCRDVETGLGTAGIKVKGDYRMNYSPGWKFNHWELKGVPIRVEIGPKDIEHLQVVAVRRDTGEKRKIPKVTASIRLKELLDTIQTEMLQRATKELNGNKMVVKEWKDFTRGLDEKKMLLAPFCGLAECEDKIKADSARDEAIEPGAPSMGAKSLCIPFKPEAVLCKTNKCIHPDCKRGAEFYTLFGRSY